MFSTNYTGVVALSGRCGPELLPDHQQGKNNTFFSPPSLYNIDKNVTEHHKLSFSCIFNELYLSGGPLISYGQETPPP